MSKYLGNVNICGIKFRVTESNAEEDPELSASQAYIELDEATITVRDDLPRDHFVDAILHEIIHGIVGCSGLDAILSQATGLKLYGKKLDRLEEIIVRVMTPHLVQALASSYKIMESAK